MDKHWYCRGQLKAARFEAKIKHISLPYIKSTYMHQDNYAVFADGIPALSHDSFEYREYAACCTFDARTQFINEFINYTGKS